MSVSRVVRSPDGEARSYPMGQLSIQRAAASILEQYYATFPIYNPYLDTIPSKTGASRGSHRDNYKYYDVDGMGNMVTDKVRTLHTIFLSTHISNFNPSSYNCLLFTIPIQLLNIFGVGKKFTDTN